MKVKCDMIEGVPVWYDLNSPHIATARGFLWGKRIVVGPRYYMLPSRQRKAVLYHEVHHCKAFHMEWRVLLFPTFLTKWNERKMCEQEFDADHYAAEKGYAIDLLHVLRENAGINRSEYHPSVGARCACLIIASREKIHEIAA